MTMALRIRGLRWGLLALAMLGLMAPLAVPAQARDTDSKATPAVMGAEKMKLHNIQRLESKIQRLEQRTGASVTGKIQRLENKMQRLQERAAVSVTGVAPASINVKQTKVAKSAKGDDD
jgi:hypothetical protein